MPTRRDIIYKSFRRSLTIERTPNARLHKMTLLVSQCKYRPFRKIRFARQRKMPRTSQVRARARHVRFARNLRMPCKEPGKLTGRVKAATAIGDSRPGATELDAENSCSARESADREILSHDLNCVVTPTTRRAACIGFFEIPCNRPRYRTGKTTHAAAVEQMNARRRSRDRARARARVTRGERKNALFPLPRGRHIFLIASRELRAAARGVHDAQCIISGRGKGEGSGGEREGKGKWSKTSASKETPDPARSSKLTAN